MEYQVVNGQPQWTFWLYDIHGKRMAQIGVRAAIGQLGVYEPRR